MIPTNAERLPTLELTFLDSPATKPVRLKLGDEFTIGRAPECGVFINNPSVSREHAVLRFGEEGVSIEDRNSRHGTLVNGVRTREGGRVRIVEGDVIKLGPERIRLGRVYERIRTDMPISSAEELRTVVLGGRTGGDQAMRVLREVMRANPSEMSEEAAGRLLLERVQTTAGVERAMIVRMIPGSSEAQIVARVGIDIGNASRTVIAAAEEGGRVAHLSLPDQIGHLGSIAGAGVCEILCARLQVRADPHLYIYADSRSAARFTGGDVAEFVGAAAGLGGLVFDGIALRKLGELRQHYARAAAVQKKLLPDRTGSTGTISWALDSIAAAPPDEANLGTNVSGDIVGVARRPDGSTLAWIGDVCGHGIGAALLMSAAQSWLHAAAGRVEDPAVTVAALNEFLYQHTEPFDFASLWVAAFELNGDVLVCDAGHGHAFRVGAAGLEPLDFAEDDGGCVIGAMPDTVYASVRVRLAAGERLVLTTDGVRESRASDGAEFGSDRVVEALRGSTGSDDDLRRIHEALMRFSKGVRHDDVTVLSLARES